jgi:uncharacterized membrane protein YdjX (TVP38/TMEM64 family)
MKHLKTGIWIVLVLLVLLGVYLFTPVKALFDERYLVVYLHAGGRWAALLYVVIFTVATVLGFPSNVMTVAGGAVFGLIGGTVCSLLGATLGAVGAFCLTRSLLHNWVEQRFGHHPLLQRLKQSISRTPFYFVLAVRFTPISPFSLVNFLFGLTPIDLRTYTFGTFLGIIPLTLTYTWLGVTGQQAFSGGDRLPFAIALGFLALLSIMPMLAKKSAPS